MPKPPPIGVSLGEPVSVQGEPGWIVCGIYKPLPADLEHNPDSFVLEVMHP